MCAKIITFIDVGVAWKKSGLGGKWHAACSHSRQCFHQRLWVNGVLCRWRPCMFALSCRVAFVVAVLSLPSETPEQSHLPPAERLASGLGSRNHVSCWRRCRPTPSLFRIVRCDCLGVCNIRGAASVSRSRWSRCCRVTMSSRPPRDCYEVLGVARGASEAEIKKAYRRAALKHHPDKQSGKTEAEVAAAKERFTEIGQAYSILSDPQKRRQYDLGGLDSANGGGNGSGSSSSWSSGPRRTHSSSRSYSSSAGQDPFGGFGLFHGGFSFDDANSIFATFFGGRDPFAGFSSLPEDDLFRSPFDRDGPFSAPATLQPGGAGSIADLHARMHNDMMRIQSSVFDRDPFGHERSQRAFGRANSDSVAVGGSTFDRSARPGPRRAASLNSASSAANSVAAYGAAPRRRASVSTSTRTTIINGRRRSVTTKTVTHPDGRVETTTEETEGDAADGGMGSFGGSLMDGFGTGSGFGHGFSSQAQLRY